MPSPCSCLRGGMWDPGEGEVCRAQWSEPFPPWGRGPAFGKWVKGGAEEGRGYV